MSDIQLFRIAADDIQPIEGTAVAVEKSLQALIETHLEALLGVRFLATEYATTKAHGGRIDTLGLDDSNSPVIIEYKRALNQNVINQGLFYLNWLLDHHGDFKLLVLEKLGVGIANQIEWRYPRLICIAADFTRYDEHAIHQMPRNIDLIRYRRYGDDLLLLERVATSATPPSSSEIKSTSTPSILGHAHETADTRQDGEPYVAQQLSKCSSEVQNWFQTLRAFIFGLGDDIEERTLKQYIAFRQLKTFAYVRFSSKQSRIVVDVPLAPDAVVFEQGFTTQKQGNWVQITIDSAEDVERAQPLIARGYQLA